MPRTPHPITGIVYDVDGTTTNNAVMIIYNLNNGDTIQTKTDSSGVYLIDLANARKEWVEGQKILIRAYYPGNFYRGSETEALIIGDEQTINLFLQVSYPTQLKDIAIPQINRIEHNPVMNAKRVMEPSMISAKNSSNIPLKANGVFTGKACDILHYGVIIITLKSNVKSAIDGLSVQFSPDGTNWDSSDDFTIPAGSGKTFSFQPVSRYMRIVYTNGSSDQVYFRMITILKPDYVKPSSHRIQDSIIDEDDAELVKSVLTGEDDLTGNFDNVSTYRKSLNVNASYVHRKIVNETFHQHTGVSTNPSIAPNEGDTSITVVNATGFITGGEIKIEDSIDGIGVQEIGILKITNVVGSVITLDRPLGFDYTTLASIESVITNMAVLGSLTSPEIFEIDPPVGTIWQFTRILFSILDGTAMGDGLFGGMDPLTNGVCLRATTEAGRTVVFGNWKTNGDMKLDMYDVDYAAKPPADQFGLSARWTFTKAEVVAELSGDASPIQKLEILIQDDLRDLVSFIMRGQGRVFSP